MNLCTIIGIIFYGIVAELIIPIVPGKRFKAFICIKVAGGHYVQSSASLEKPIEGLKLGQCKYCKNIPDYLKEKS